MDSLSLVGLATPQANPTVELEFREFFTGDVCAQVTRLTSAADTPAERLLHYMEQIPTTLNRYDTMPLAAFAFACTGSSYLKGAEYENALTDALADERGYPLITATQAIENELRIRGVRRLGILAPYPADLCQSANQYWQDKDYEVVLSKRIDIGADTRGIYALTNDILNTKLGTLSLNNIDALLLSGTGMPTVAALRSSDLPMISSNLCLAVEVLRQLGRWGLNEPADIQRLCGN
ncbi:MAG: hypothetical protein AB8B96_21105 [Lysobacterales bacterium]